MFVIGPVVQLYRTSDSGSESRGLESRRGHQLVMKQFFEDTKPGGQLLALMLILVLLFIVSVGFFAVPALFGLNVDALLAQGVTQVSVFGGTAVVFAWMFYGNPLKYLRIEGAERLAVKMLASFLILLCLIPLSDWLTRVNDAMHMPQALGWFEDKMRQMGETSQETMKGFLLCDGVGKLIANIFVLAFLPAVCEELLFRGAMQQTMVRCFNGRHHLAIILTAAVFSLFHFELFAFLPRFALGIALGYLFHYGGSLWVNAIAHFANNAIVVVVYYLAYKGVVDIEMADSINAPWYLAIVGLALAVFLFWLVFLKPKSEESVNEKY